MDFLGDVLQWFLDPANWTNGVNQLTGVPEIGILSRTWEHVQISVITVAIAVGITVPPAMLLGHAGRGGFLAVSLANIGRAVPSFAIVVLGVTLTGRIGFWPTFIALLALAIPPIFTNTFTGIRAVDRDTVEAARGMGLTERQILWSIELPMATPVVLAAVRVAAVQVVATATLGAIVAWGGLGRFIIDGFAQRDNVEVFAGALLVALLAVLTEVTFGILERFVVPPGLGRRGAAT